MAELGFAFNPSEVPVDDTRDALPAGEYIAQIVDSEMKATKNGNGQMLVLQWEILDGPQRTRRHFQRLNIRNSNATAQAIANRELVQIAAAFGIGAFTNSNVLHHKPAYLKIGPQKNDPQYAEVKGVRAYVPPAPQIYTPQPAPAPQGAPQTYAPQTYAPAPQQQQAAPAPAPQQQYVAPVNPPAGSRPWPAA